MAFCRAALIERLLNNDNGQRVTSFGVSRSWNDIDSFERDNIAEVYRKLVNIEEQIWGKLIVMERNIRSAKAYLRSRIITIDGTEAEFDGLRIGLQRFTNTFRDEGTTRAFGKFEKGVKMKIDDAGNVWLKCSEGSVFVTGILGELMIFDLKIFKDYVSRNNDFNEAARDRCSRLAITYAHVDEPADPLSSAVWFAVIHLTALEMIQILLPSSSASNTSSSSASAELRSTYRHPCGGYSQSSSGVQDANCSGRTASSTSSGSGSSSHYSAASYVCWNRQPRSRGGAYKKINRETNVYTSSRNAVRPNALEQRKEKGRSLLNLSDLDRLRNPAYFRNERENRGGVGHNRINRARPLLTTTNSQTPPCCSSNINWRSRSEASLYCERL